MPASDLVYDGYYNASPECWSVYTEILGTEFGNAWVFAQVHQLSVDTYAVQHAGGPHPDKSVAVHLVGLHLALVRGIASTRVTRLLKQMADARTQWPHFAPPADRSATTVFDVAMAASAQQHVELVRRWAGDVWSAWSACHVGVAALAGEHFGRP